MADYRVPPPRHRTARTLAVVLALAAATTACGDDDPQTEADSDAGSASASAAPAAAAESGASTADSPTPTAAPELTEEVTIRFENYNLAAAGPGRDATMKLLEAFEAEHPLITVETSATTSEEMFPSLQAQVVAGDPPDVAQLLLREWDQNVENLPVADLESVVGEDELAAHLEGEHPFHPRATALTVRDERTYGLAYVFSTPTLFYNADVFRAAGLDPDDPPTTWDEVATAAETIGDATEADGIYIACIELDWCTQGLVRSNGGRVMTEDRSEITWAGPESLEVFSFWQDLVTSGAHVDMSGADAQDAFAVGNLGMFLQTSAVQGSLLQSAEGNWELRATGMPSFGERAPVPVNSGSGLGILTDDPVKQRAAWELMKFLTSEDAMQIITTEMGYLPLRPDMVDDPAYLADWEHRDLITPNLDQLDQLEPSLSFPGQNALQIRDLFLGSLEQVLFDGADVTETFTESQERAAELVR